MTNHCLDLRRLTAAGLCLFCTAVVYVACGSGSDVVANPGAPYVRLNISSFGFTPPSPIHLGDTLTFSARVLEQQVVSVQVLATGESNGDLRVELHDDGVAPDETAGDAMYTGAAVWAPELGTGIMAVSLSVQAMRNGELVSDKRLTPWLHVEP